MLAIHAQMGWLPRWGYANFDTNIMTGDPVTPFLVDLWKFGALEGDERQAWQALWQNANDRPPAMSRAQGRAGNDSYLAQGFVPYDRAFPSKGMDVDPHHGASATLEYALGDCALAQMAGALGENDAAAKLRARGGNWRRLWDAELVDKDTGFRGFPRPRVEDGSWFLTPRGAYEPRSQHGFHEGTAWQYQWLVPQDVPGLVAAMGGAAGAGKRLDAFFGFEGLLADPAGGARKQWVVGSYDYYNQFRYNPNNEPDLHAPWMYTLIGQPAKTAVVLRAAQSLFTNAPNGVTGNDDLGTMSAWYLFSAMGLYPGMPGTGRLLLHPPRFERVELDLADGKMLRIDAPGAAGPAVKYIQDVRFDGATTPQVWLDWNRIRAGGELQYTLGETPGAWGTHGGDLPPAACPTGAAP
jgi:predicted alpha-1,2-mannosidase